MSTIQPNTGDWPNEQPPDPDQTGQEAIPWPRAPREVSLNDLLDAEAEPPAPPPPAGTVLHPSCRAGNDGERTGRLALLRRVIFGGRTHAWRVTLLTLMSTGAVCAVLFAGSAAAKMMVLSLAGLTLLARLAQRSNRTRPT